MTIIVNDLAYHYDNQPSLFEHLDFAVGAGRKVSVTGNNGTGKSTLLKLLAGELHPSCGEITCGSKPYYMPQQIGYDDLTVAQALGIADKMAALRAITEGSTLQSDYDTLADDWDIEPRCKAALDHWRLSHLDPFTAMHTLSGGEKTKVLLAGLLVHQPEIILLDEPTNHLDSASRELLYNYLHRTKSTVLTVSHDITLLDQLETTYELSPKGIRLYGGNFSFFQEQKILETNALNESIQAEEKDLRLARLKAQEVKQRQERRESRGERNKGEVIRILRKTMLNRGENTGAKLRDKHTRIISESRNKLTELRQQRDAGCELKIDFADADLHNGKLLLALSEINHSYTQDRPLWDAPLSLELFSGDRVRILGNNGSGKTTLIKIITAELTPTTGTVQRADFSYIYMDQEYSQVIPELTVLELAERYNLNHLADHEIKIRLHRALFGIDSWDKPCRALSGGEKMRLYLCCLMLSNHIPDLFILDEPTNNLDIASLGILTRTIKNYRGSVLLVSHDRHFANEIGINKEVNL